MDDLFSVLNEPPARPTGALSRVLHFAEQARAGRLAALEALELAEAEVREYLGRQAAARDAEVRGNSEGKVAADPRATSARAARAVQPKTGNQRGRILTDICEHDGATDFEVVRRLGLLDSSCRPRRGELVEGGFIRDSGRVRQHQGSDWTVWEPTDLGRAWYQAAA